MKKRLRATTIERYRVDLWTIFGNTLFAVRSLAEVAGEYLVVSTPQM